MAQRSTRRISTAALVITSVLFALMTLIAHWAATGARDPDDQRAINAMWVAALFAIPALCLYALRPRSQAGKGWWLLLWTFAYLAFLIHLYWAFFGVFRGDFSLVWTHPSVDTPILSVLLSVWWGLDVLLAWLLPAGPCWVRVQRALVHLFLFVMLAAAMLQAPPFRWLGVLLLILVPICYVIGVVRTPTAMMRFLKVAYGIVNRFIVWHRLPAFLAAKNLLPFRDRLRSQNLHDTNAIPTSAGSAPQAPPYHPGVLFARTSDGSYNDLGKPTMGMAGTRFGRNVSLEQTAPEAEPALLQPSPREISRRLMTRNEFVPARSLNLLAAAWIQFMTHDWFNHGKPARGNEFRIDLVDGDDWHENPMLIRRTPPDPTRAPNDGHGPATFINPGSHWWDGSQIYGSDAATTDRLRRHQDGKLRTVNDPTGHAAQQLADEASSDVELAGFSDNWWIGLSLMHTLFTLEHNAICDRLRLEYPHWSDDHLYHTARLVNVALLAKIHTVEWTPAILAHPAIKIALGTNWWGLFGERIRLAFGRIGSGETLSGIPGSVTDQHGVAFSLTEEFVSVYRLHPLMPDEFLLYSAADGTERKKFTMLEVVGRQAREVALGHGSMTDLFYSFGIAHPGAVTLHNYPRFLQRLERHDETGKVDQIIDLAAIDILRDRERGVPRYNKFRELMHLPPFTSIEQLTPNKTWVKELNQLYGGDVNRVDLMVGLFAETFPEGFGFSDTAFRVFILMASRRLKSDRFFTTDYTPEVYTRTGLDWIDRNDMSSVLVRHYPELKPILTRVPNAFAPWPRIELPAQHLARQPAPAAES